MKSQGGVEITSETRNRGVDNFQDGWKCATIDYVGD